MKKILIPIVSILLLATITYFIFSGKSKTQQEKELFFSVEKKDFPVNVMATGELDSKKSVKIRGPRGMQAAGIYETTLSDILAEGTILKEGDYVASLDRTQLANKMGDIQIEIDKIETQLEQAKIDTAIELRELRDQMVNNKFALQEKKITLELNKYEAKSIIRQSQLDLERSERDYNQLMEKYELKKKQSVAKVKEILSQLRKNQRDMQQLQQLGEEFNIKAPSDGMLIYSRTWNGKIEPGSRITAWNPVVAELPDLTDMISKLYVNEVDISKVDKGQDVKINIDAFPNLEYSGTVIKVANIGEQVRGYDTKVFEVIVQVLESDSIMRPAMTTSNKILTANFENVLSIPLEGIYNDSLSYVYKRKGDQIIKQEVLPGPANNDAIIIEFGLEEGDQVLLSQIDPNKEYKFQPIDPKIKEDIERKLNQQLAKRKEAARKKAAQLNSAEIETSSSSSSPGGGIIIIN